jgi:organic hydroperoxide reductase OsmC/OhrA
MKSDKTHHYKTTINWTGNKGSGTTHYEAYNRDYSITIENKPDLAGSSDLTFRGDPTKHNPEELLLASLSACHMLWYLHLCADAGIVVVKYSDDATGTMEIQTNGGGRFTEVVLNPVVEVLEQGMINAAEALHQKASERCFIANSVNFPVRHNPVVR